MDVKTKVKIKPIPLRSKQEQGITMQKGKGPGAKTIRGHDQVVKSGKHYQLQEPNYEWNYAGEHEGGGLIGTEGVKGTVQWGDE